MALALENIRALVQNHDYTEIEMNQKSKLISFRKGSTRINVYFTTGTVGTCLNHPKRGKTQLFRRNKILTSLMIYLTIQECILVQDIIANTLPYTEMEV